MSPNTKSSALVNGSKVQVQRQIEVTALLQSHRIYIDDVVDQIEFEQTSGGKLNIHCMA